jgi:hypothetical protein
MVRRSRKYRKRFSCRHRGFGQYCHRCLAVRVTHSLPLDQPETVPQQLVSKTEQVWKTAKQRLVKQQWQESFVHDPIDLTHLPKPIVLKTRKILESLNQGVAPGQLQGKRFNFDRTLLRIPITYRYRLLCRWYCDRIIPVQVLTHEAYNAVVRNKRHLKGS